MADLTDEQLKIIEENRRLAQEKKRKREEAALSEVPSGSKPPSKHVVLVEAKQISEKQGFAIHYGDAVDPEEEDDVVDLNADDMRDYLDDEDPVASQEFYRHYD